jgi:hypothetical protein
LPKVQIKANNKKLQFFLYLETIKIKSQKAILKEGLAFFLLLGCGDGRKAYFGVM